MSKHPVSAAPDIVTGPKVPEWKPAEIAVLGTMPDADAARLLRRSLSAVVRRRRGLRIPEFEKTPSKLSRPWKPEEERLLGTMRDEDVAAQTGRPVSGITQRRAKKGIPVAVRQTRCSARCRMNESLRESSDPSKAYRADA